jgi:hypothetical protein
MFRQILLPGAILMALCIGGCSFALWDLFHAKFRSSWNPSEAYAGELTAQRRLASCYMTGCVTVPHDPALACAWRTIIADEEKRRFSKDVGANTVCDYLSRSAWRTVPALVADIRLQMREYANIHLQPQDRERAPTAHALPLGTY